MNTNPRLIEQHTVQCEPLSDLFSRVTAGDQSCAARIVKAKCELLSANNN